MFLKMEQTSSMSLCWGNTVYSIIQYRPLNTWFRFFVCFQVKGACAVWCNILYSLWLKYQSHRKTLCWHFPNMFLGCEMPFAADSDSKQTPGQGPYSQKHPHRTRDWSQNQTLNSKPCHLRSKATFGFMHHTRDIIHRENSLVAAS